MSIEKKLGLCFLGLLVLSFCGVLAIRLADDTPETPINVDLRGPNETAGLAPSSTATGPKTAPANAASAFAAPRSFAGGAAPSTGSRVTMPSAVAASNSVGPSDNRYGTPGGGFANGRSAAPPASSDPFRAGAAPTRLGAAPVASAPAASLPSAPSSTMNASASPAAAASPYGGTPNRYGTAPSAALPTLPTSAGPASNTAGGLSSSPPSALAAAPAATAGLSFGSSTPAGSTSAGNPLRGASPATASPAVAAGDDRYGRSNADAPATLPTGPAPAMVSQPLRSMPSVPTQAPAGAPFASTSSVAQAPTSSPDRSPGVAALAAPSSPSAFSGAVPAAGGNLSSTPASIVAPASAALPIVAADKPYTVAPDDSFWSISEKMYGDGAYYRALYAYNSDRYRHAEDVRVGSVLDIPDVATLKRRFPELIGNAAGATNVDPALTAGSSRGTGAASYVVQEGDTLFEIARKQLGKASRWTEIYQLNRAALGDNLENLRPGMPLALPTGS